MTRRDWLLNRRKGIGSSDVASILGVSKFMTLMELYEEKISTDEPEEESNFIMDLGNEVEPKVRDLFNFLKDRNYEVALVQMESFPFMKASLDGRDGEHIIEIKLMGKEDHENALKKGVVPAHYYPQVQHALLCSNAKSCFFASYPYGVYKDNRSKPLDSAHLAIIEVFPDKDYQLQLLEKCNDFWNNNVLKKKPPLPSDKDYKTIRGIAVHVNRYKALKERMEMLEQQLEMARKAIIDAAEKSGHPRLKAGDFRMQKVARQGSVNYKKMISDYHPELLDHEDEFRGKGSVSWRMEVLDDETV